METTDDMNHELRRAAYAGGKLHEARTRFRRYAEETMNLFETAEGELAKTEPDALLDAIRATDIAFARFIASTENEWDEEEDFEYTIPPDLRAWKSCIRNRLDDFRDGRLACPLQLDFVESALLRAAESLDPAAARRMRRLAETWNTDRLLHESNPAWANKNGIIPGAETAPSMSALLLLFSECAESRNPRRAHALRIASGAYRHLHLTATCYAKACYAQFNYNSILDTPVKQH